MTVTSAAVATCDFSLINLQILQVYGQVHVRSNAYLGVDWGLKHTAKGISRKKEFLIIVNK